MPVGGCGDIHPCASRIGAGTIQFPDGRGPDHDRWEVIAVAFPGYGEMTSISLRINRTPGMLFSVSCAICF